MDYIKLRLHKRRLSWIKAFPSPGEQDPRRPSGDEMRGDLLIFVVGLLALILLAYGWWLLDTVVLPLDIRRLE